MTLVIDIEDELLHRITDSIVKTCNPERIILFGSRADLTNKPDSDVDLLVIVSSSFDAHHSRFKEMARIENALRGIKIPTDLLVYSRDEFERWKEVPTHVIHQADQNGKTLYERLC